MSTRKTLIILLVSSLLFSISMSGCLNDLFDLDKMTTPELSPSLAFPLITSSITLDNLLQESALNMLEDPGTGQISFVFESEGAFSQTAEEIMNVPDQLWDFPRTVYYFPPPPGEWFVFDYPMSEEFVPEHDIQRFDLIRFKGGHLTIRYTTDIDYPGEVEIISHALMRKEDGAPFTHLTHLNNPGDGVFVVESEVPLEDYLLEFVNEGDVVNGVSFDFTLRISGDENAVERTYRFDSDILFNHIAFEQLIGYFGHYEVALTDTLHLDLFDNITGGQFEAHEHSARLDLQIHNSMGMPMQLHFDHFTAYSDVYPDQQVSIELFGPGAPNEIHVEAPGLDQMGQQVTTQPETSSNFAAALNILPSYIHFEGVGTSNPAADPSVTNFLLDSSALQVDIRTRLELFGLLQGFVLQDTLPFNAGFPEEVSSAELKLKITNGFPIEVELQIFLIDSDINVLDSLFKQGPALVTAAPVGPAPDHRVTQTPESLFIIDLPEETIGHMDAASHMVIRAVLSSYQRDFVRIYADYGVDIQMSAILNTQTNQ